MEVNNMKKCKWAGDFNDEYCKSCDGITMEVDGNSISCEKCAGYEEGEEEINSEDVDMTPTEADKKAVEKTDKNLDKDSNFMPTPETEEEELPFESELSTKVVENEAKKPAESKKTNNNTKKAKETKIEDKNKATTNKTEVKKVSEEHDFTENVSMDGINVTSIRYTSGATVKKGDNYFKFIAEEEWDVSRIEDVQEAREKLWAKLNAEVDSQIEELNNMN